MRIPKIRYARERGWKKIKVFGVKV